MPKTNPSHYIDKKGRDVLFFNELNDQEKTAEFKKWTAWLLGNGQKPNNIFSLLTRKQYLKQIDAG